MHTRTGRIILWVVSGVSALMLLRVVSLLMAADPTHPFVQFLHWFTDPLVWPVAWLDAAQPQVGVRFERGTLLLAGSLLLIALISGWAIRKDAQRGRGA